MFAWRLLSLPEVSAIEIDPLRARATVRYRDIPGDHRAVAGRIADALEGKDDPESGSMPVWRPGETASLRSYSGIITTLEILTVKKHRLEIRYRPTRRDPSASSRITDALRQIPGLLEATIEAGKLILRFDPAVLSTVDLVRHVEAELLTLQNSNAEKVSFGMANVSLGVSSVGEFVLPAVMPAAAVLLVVNNLDAVGDAAEDLSVGKIGLPLLYTGIMAMTVISGQFLSAAVMFWFFRLWEQKYRRDLVVENQALLNEIVGTSGESLTINADGVELFVPHSEISEGQRLRVRAGERIPVDATVLDGAALVDEAKLLGNPAPATRAKGDEVLAGSLLLAGELDLAVLRIGSGTRVAPVSRALISATTSAPTKWAFNRQSEEFAERTIGPTLVAAGLGLLVGGPALSTSIMRLDYATGVGLASPLETIRSVRVALRHGALIRSGHALSRFASSSWVILDDHEALERADCELAEIQVTGIDEDQLLPALAAAGVWLGDPRGPALVRACRARHLIARRAALLEISATSVAIQYGNHVLRLTNRPSRTEFKPLRVEVDNVEVARLRFQRSTSTLSAAVSVRQLQRAGLRVLLASERKESAVAPLARKLGVDRFLSNANTEFRASLLRGLGERGVKAVHVHTGPGLREPGDTHLSVALAGADEANWHDADMVLLGQSIAPLPALARLARLNADRAASMRTLALAPNLACVASAFAFGLPGLAMIFITNLGTSMVYNRSRRALHMAALDGASPGEAAWYTEDDAPDGYEAIPENNEDDTLSAKEGWYA